MGTKIGQAMKPVRLQRSRKKGFRLKSPNGLPIVYVGRGSKWGNPFYVDPEHTLDTHKFTHNPPEHIGDIFACKTAEEAVRRFSETSVNRRGLFHRPCEVGNIQRELKDKNLCCWCKIDEICHADILLQIANRKGGK